MKSKTVAAKKVRSTKPEKDTGIFGRDWHKEYNQACVARFAELVEEHGMDQLVVFSMTEQEAESLKLASIIHKHETPHLYAKTITLGMVKGDVEEFVSRLEHGTLKMIEGKAKR